MPSASKPRARLFKAQVIAIFHAKASTSSSASAAKLATVYRVSGKAIRDIWTARTWSKETWHLDMLRPLQPRLTGRPKGCRDRTPRKKRVYCHDELSRSRSSAQVSSLPHYDTLGGVGPSLVQDSKNAIQMPLNHPTNLRVVLTQCTDSAVCLEDSSAWHGSRSTWPQSSTLRHTSIDEQLHEWDGFWHTSACADPFCVDWTSHGRMDLA
jgi:hypothetical protein